MDLQVVVFQLSVVFCLVNFVRQVSAVFSVVCALHTLLHLQVVHLPGRRHFQPPISALEHGSVFQPWTYLQKIENGFDRLRCSAFKITVELEHRIANPSFYHLSRIKAIGSVNKEDFQ